MKYKPLNVSIITRRPDADSAAVALAAEGWAKGSKRERAVKPTRVPHPLAVKSSFYAFVLRRRLLPLTENPMNLVERPQMERSGRG